jgi:hypothetical protein
MSRTEGAEVTERDHHGDAETRRKNVKFAPARLPITEPAATATVPLHGLTASAKTKDELAARRPVRPACEEAARSEIQTHTNR